ncbi:hypothetical protein HRbin11_01769 [bacterium HR11]|nr:hypothetical protein HRbin11_01769 [bacterium HR11]
MKSLWSLVALIGLSLLTAPTQAWAQGPTVPEALQVILRLEGRWVASATWQTNGRSYMGQSVFHFRKTADGLGLTMDESADVPALGRISGANLIGYDPSDGRLHWFTVDNSGMSHHRVGELVDRDHLRLVHEGYQDGKPYREEFDIRWESPDRFYAKRVSTLDGQVTGVFEGTFLRQGARCTYAPPTPLGVQVGVCQIVEESALAGTPRGGCGAFPLSVNIGPCR